MTEGVVSEIGIVRTCGPLSDEERGRDRAVGEGAATRTESASKDGPLRLFQADHIARTYAAKQFLADMLAEWKRIARAASRVGIDRDDGLGGYIDVETAELRKAALTWEDIQRTRKALSQRGTAPRIAEAMESVEASASREVSRLLRKHPLWPWLSQFPGLGGVHVAYLIGVIRHPLRFPGQVCAEGHHQPAVYPVGYRCGQRGWVDGEQVECDAPLGPERPGTGSRSLWRYLGLDVEEGRSPRKQKGKKAHWHPRARASVQQPMGLAEQIVRQRVPRYRDIYDAKKASLIEKRGLVVVVAEIDGWRGGVENEDGREISPGPADPVSVIAGAGGGAEELHEGVRPGGPADARSANGGLSGGAA